MTTVCCYDVYGNAIPVAPEAITFRPAVYGIFIEDDHILLLRHPQTALWHPPGSILAPHETPTQAVRYTFRELTGMTPVLGPLLFVEDQYLVDDERRAWHLSVLYYALDRPTAMATTLAEMENSSQPDWKPLAELKRNQMQFGYEAIQAGWLRLRL
ncbi:MAG TPA: NUDIX domain-containing protein [Anaerolineae bacterium]